MAEKKLKIFTLEEYLAFENQSDVKSEFDHGSIVAMSGGTLNHGIIGNNINTELNNAVKGKGTDCVTINGDVRIYIEKADSVVYPDAMVICGDIQTAEPDRNAVINPVLIIEVLSKSTESYDRGDKFHKYCFLPSFKEYVLIDQNKPVVDVLYKETAAYWKMVTTIGLEKTIYLNTLDCHIQLSDVYRNTQNLAVPQFKLDL